jgi:hypothetical protein
MKLFKEIEIGTEFTSPDLCAGNLVKISPKKYTTAPWIGNEKGTVCPINTQCFHIPVVTPILMEDGTPLAEVLANQATTDDLAHGNSPEGAYMGPLKDDLIAESGLPVEKFDPTAIIAEIRRKAWKNYDVSYNYHGEIVTIKLGEFVTAPDFKEWVTWDESGKPLFNEDLSITLPEGVAEPDYTGLMEAAIPDTYKRRVTLLRAQDMSGLELYAALIAANNGRMTAKGTGVSRAAHLSAVKTNTRKNNRARRASRKRNMTSAARTSQGRHLQAAA